MFLARTVILIFPVFIVLGIVQLIIHSRHNGKKVCSGCDKKLGVMSTDIQDGVICFGCLTLSKIKPKNAMDYTPNLIKGLVEKATKQEMHVLKNMVQRMLADL